jgi:hypothetical protein
VEAEMIELTNVTVSPVKITLPPRIQHIDVISLGVLTDKQLNDISKYIKDYFGNELQWPSWYIIAYNKYTAYTSIRVLVTASCKSVGEIIQFKFNN